MRQTILTVTLGTAFLTGCAGSSSSSTSPGHDHPANPAAAQAPAGESSQTLALNPATPAATRAGATLYACPMHKEVTSANPNDKCPKCSMKINKPVPGAATKQTVPAPAPAQEHNHGGGAK